MKLGHNYIVGGLDLIKLLLIARVWCFPPLRKKTSVIEGLLLDTVMEVGKGVGVGVGVILSYKPLFLLELCVFIRLCFILNHPFGSFGSVLFLFTRIGIGSPDPHAENLKRRM